ncbi:single-stranded DNA-binding protein [Weeksellaceae bacterium KMM 9713]|uniref:Single-stranded DNA-binding protein n=1 Tax=Profundicola chukchiensis TaxID=2961959 RepID=A0A9X4MY45_9FLAO|nr:single-stranded DNA-binding protein [Profundicola chukchiensis]MDG4945670.1 single-stranded DNA-binding protein [Profundicola chukchiensis]MDG4949391.1 single-stranded DNA-binding protein [Profundicola chukchiensis]
MSGSLNKVMLIGNLGDDVKIHYFDDKNCIARFPMATNETYTLRESNERVTQTEWHRVVTRNRLAELCEKYLSKGDTVFVEGKIKTRKWNDNGVDRYQTEIHAETIQFLNTKKSSGQSEEASYTRPSEESKSDTQVNDSNEDNSSNELNDDLPF